MPTAQTITTPGDERMEITTRFGKQQIDPSSVVHFPDGLPGFEGLQDFKLFHEEGKPTVFYLQSLQDPDIQFPVVNPDAYQVNYECVLSDHEARTLQLEDPTDVAVLVTLARGGDSDDGIHANFMGPIILNTAKRIGLQKQLNEVSGSVVIRAE